MSEQTHQRLIPSGFILAYAAVTGSLALLNFHTYGDVFIKFVLLPLGIIVGVLITIAR